MTTDLPFRHDDVTMTCPVCGQAFPPSGRRRFCTDACRSAAYRRRRDDQPTPVSMPTGRPRRPITVYECVTCGSRALGQQRCDDCNIFMTRIGYGGLCPSCSEPVAVNDLLDQEVTHLT